MLCLCRELVTDWCLCVSWYCFVAFVEGEICWNNIELLLIKLEFRTAMLLLSF